MARSPEQQAQSMIDHLPEKTGRSLDAWIQAIGAHGAVKHGAIVKWLKAEHGVTHGYANLIAHLHLQGGSAAGSGADDAAAMIDAQYAGKESLRPIFEVLRKEIAALGDDLEFAPKKTYLSVRRSKQFALIQPSTKTRLDVGIQNKGPAPEGRLEASGSWNAMVSHRVRLERVEDVDAELIGWLREAYQRA